MEIEGRLSLEDWEFSDEDEGALERLMVQIGTLAVSRGLRGQSRDFTEERPYRLFAKTVAKMLSELVMEEIANPDDPLISVDVGKLGITVIFNMKPEMFLHIPWDEVGRRGTLTETIAELNRINHEIPE